VVGWKTLTLKLLQRRHCCRVRKKEWNLVRSRSRNRSRSQVDAEAEQAEEEV
jgi:hypothetical protein